MKLPRRQFLHMSVGAAELTALPRLAAALDYPMRPVRMVVGFPAGTATDITARVIGMQRSKIGRYSITTSARSSSGSGKVIRVP